MNRRDERGSVIVEAPFCICILLLFAFGIVTLSQVMWTHVDLSAAVRDATRYASRTEYDPHATPATAERRRTVDEVKQWVAEVAAEAGVSVSDLTITTPGDKPLEQLTSGDQITVTIRHKVTNPLYELGASTTNALAGLFNAGSPFDPTGVTVKAEATTYVE